MAVFQYKVSENLITWIHLPGKVVFILKQGPWYKTTQNKKLKQTEV